MPSNQENDQTIKYSIWETRTNSNQPAINGKTLESMQIINMESNPMDEQEKS
ncbi:hypothetical protein [Neobacillus sp. D3-1R]|uniref:hypothetical protein n=1 Tax=Neobacillus sp. D3-1R TaxID=3445778 RepID=UPI003F9F9029